MNIVLEGLWFGSLQVVTEALATQYPERVDRVIACPRVTPHGGMVGWMQSLTRSSEIWRKQVPKGEVTIFEHSPFSTVAYTKAFSSLDGHDLGDQEHDLFVRIVDGLKELIPNPDLIIILEHDLESEPMKDKELYYDVDLGVLEALNENIHDWAQSMMLSGVQVLYVQPPKDTTLTGWRKWYTNLAKLISLQIKEHQSDN